MGGRYVVVYWMQYKCSSMGFGMTSTFEVNIEAIAKDACARLSARGFETTYFYTG